MFYRDINKVADGIGAKFGRLFSCVVTFFAGYAIGFTYVWQLTLVLVATFPLIVLVGGLMAKVKLVLYECSIPR